jgi:magnesium transporter
VRAHALALPQDATVGGAVEEIRRRGEDVWHLFAVDAESRPTGVVSMRDLVLSRPETPIRSVMHSPVVIARAGEDREAVARRLLRGRFPALPVVDPEGRLAGVVTADEVMDVIEQGATADTQQMFGAGADEHLDSPWLFSVRKRLPWLAVNLVLAALGASVVGFFEGTIGAWAVLAMYMPVVAGMGGNASAQAMAVAIRGIAVGEADRMSLRRVVRREVKVGVASGLVTGAAAAAVATFLHFGDAPLLGALVALSLLVNHAVACAWGAAVPLVMKSLGFDPAQSATIFTTALTDMVGFFTLLGLATLSLRWLGS